MIITCELLRTLAKIVIRLSVTDGAIFARLELITEIDQLTAVLSTVSFGAVLARILVFFQSWHTQARSTRLIRIAETDRCLAFESSKTRQTLTLDAVRYWYTLLGTGWIATSLWQ